MASGRSIKVFSPDRDAVFVRRPNRFLIIARDGDAELACHCPNPGRLIEFVFPGMNLILEKRAETRAAAKTQWTAVGIHYHGAVAPLFSARANAVAEQLILDTIIPGLREVHAEFLLGGSRFDFLCIDQQGNRHLVEVKACSLVEYGTAMFPDAPSLRALKHLEELAALSREGYTSHILFVIVHGGPERFIPNLHADPAFAAALGRLAYAPPPEAARRSGKTAVHAALIRCDAQGQAVLAKPFVPVDLSCGVLAEQNRGGYLLLVEIPQSQTVPVGALGTLPFSAGWYVYAGTARKNLSQRLNRHLRKTRKGRHWHIDYLTPYAGKLKALPILSYRNLECDLAHALEDLGGRAVAGFGASDCRCKSHCYYFAESPMENRRFVETLLRFRHVEWRGPGEN